MFVFQKLERPPNEEEDIFIMDSSLETQLKLHGTTESTGSEVAEGELMAQPVSARDVAISVTESAPAGNKVPSPPIPGDSPDNPDESRDAEERNLRNGADKLGPGVPDLSLFHSADEVVTVDGVKYERDLIGEYTAQMEEMLDEYDSEGSSQDSSPEENGDDEENSESVSGEYELEPGQASGVLAETIREEEEEEGSEDQPDSLLLSSPQENNAKSEWLVLLDDDDEQGKDTGQFVSSPGTEQSKEDSGLSGSLSDEQKEEKEKLGTQDGGDTSQPLLVDIETEASESNAERQQMIEPNKDDRSTASQEEASERDLQEQGEQSLSDTYSIGEPDDVLKIEVEEPLLEAQRAKSPVMDVDSPRSDGNEVQTEVRESMFEVQEMEYEVHAVQAESEDRKPDISGDGDSHLQDLICSLSLSAEPTAPECDTVEEGVEVEEPVLEVQRAESPLNTGKRKELESPTHLKEQDGALASKSHESEDTATGSGKPEAPLDRDLATAEDVTELDGGGSQAKILTEDGRGESSQEDVIASYRRHIEELKHSNLEQLENVQVAIKVRLEKGENGATDT